MGTLAVLSVRFTFEDPESETEEVSEDYEPIRFIYGETILEVYNKLRLYGKLCCYSVEGDTHFEAFKSRVVGDMTEQGLTNISYDLEMFLSFVEEGIMCDPDSNIIESELLNGMAEKFTPALVVSIKKFMDSLDREFKNSIKGKFPQIRDRKDQESILRLRNFLKINEMKE